MVGDLCWLPFRAVSSPLTSHPSSSAVPLWSASTNDKLLSFVHRGQSALKDQLPRERVRRICLPVVYCCNLRTAELLVANATVGCSAHRIGVDKLARCCRFDLTGSSSQHFTNLKAKLLLAFSWVVCGFPCVSNPAPSAKPCCELGREPGV